MAALLISSHFPPVSYISQPPCSTSVFWLLFWVSLPLIFFIIDYNSSRQFFFFFMFLLHMFAKALNIFEFADIGVMLPSTSMAVPLSFHHGLCHDRRFCSLHCMLHILYILGCNLHWCSLFYDGPPTLWTCEWDLLGPVIIDHIYCTSPLFIIAFCCKMSNLSICVLIPEKYGKIGDRITVNPIFGRCVLHVHLCELTTTSNTGWVGDYI